MSLRFENVFRRLGHEESERVAGLEIGLVMLRRGRRPGAVAPATQLGGVECGRLLGEVVPGVVISAALPSVVVAAVIETDQALQRTRARLRARGWYKRLSHSTIH